MICVDEMGDDVNRESGTTVAKRRWLQRMLGIMVNLYNLQRKILVFLLQCNPQNDD